MLRRILLLSEITHSVAHILVLFNMTWIFDFDSMPDWFKIHYFMVDLVSSLSSFLYLISSRKRLSRVYHWMILIHAGIHLTAILFRDSVIYADAFRLAEGKVEGISLTYIFLYTLGTLQDILTHTWNAIYLS